MFYFPDDFYEFAAYELNDLIGKEFKELYYGDSEFINKGIITEIKNTLHGIQLFYICEQGNKKEIWIYSKYDHDRAWPEDLGIEIIG